LEDQGQDRNKNMKKKIYKIKKTKNLIKQLKPFWKKLKQLNTLHSTLIYELEKKMEKTTGIKEIEFFMCDNEYVGIGNSKRLRAIKCFCGLKEN